MMTSEIKKVNSVILTSNSEIENKENTSPNIPITKEYKKKNVKNIIGNLFYFIVVVENFYVFYA